MQNNTEDKNFLSSPITWIVLVIVLLCCCTLVAGLIGLGYFSAMPGSLDFIPTPIGLDSSTSTPAPQAQLTRVPVDQIPTDTVTTLEDTVVPVNNPRDLACRLEGKCSIPETLPSGPYKVGKQETFWITNTDTAKSFEVDATLQYLTPHAYFWVEDGVSYDDDEAKDLVDAFETKMYPTNREFF